MPKLNSQNWGTAVLKRQANMYNYFWEAFTTLAWTRKPNTQVSLTVL